MMRQLLALLGCVSISNHVWADNRLLGTWQSDHEQTMSFLQKHSKLESRQVEFLDQTIGHLVLEFSEHTASYLMPDLKVRLANKDQKLSGMSESHPYSVIGSDATTVVVRISRSNGTSQIVSYYFENDDTMWVYTDAATRSLSPLNIREYFRRIKK